MHLDEAYRLLLSGNTGVLVVADGKVVDIVTRIDLVRLLGRDAEAVSGRAGLHLRGNVIVLGYNTAASGNKTWTCATP